MIILDFIMANEDRHLGNFGVIRDVESLQWVAICPIFDTGRSLNNKYWFPNYFKKLLNKYIDELPLKEDDIAILVQAFKQRIALLENINK